MSRKKKLLIFGIILLILTLLSMWGFTLKTDRYKIKSDKIDKGLKIVFISDLHNCFYGGTDQSKLKDEIENAEPDILIFGGDMVDQWGGTKHAITLMEWSAEKYPCFYTPGNHEYERDDTDDFFKKVEEIGVTVCNGDYSDIEVRGQAVRIYGILEYFDLSSKTFSAPPDDSVYTILLAHQPEQIDNYHFGDGSDFDLILSGHAHAGQWRIPGILDQGLYAPDQGLFPEYTHGMYEYDDSVHIISRGLARPLRMIFIPRIFNRPELSVIEIS
ncbi:MAG: metallophosphoesterase [Ruminococcus sp.]|nr:metallophosphoesterase [Ruminococcus sp.]